MIRNIGYLPRGITYLIAAPFPWEMLSNPPWWPLIPEMILWYATVIFAILGLCWGIRHREWDIAYVVLVGLAIGGVLSLIEGNLGTLVRHRDMVVPSVIVLASIAIADRLRRREVRRA